MSLGTCALNVGRGPKHFRPRQGGIHGNHVRRNHPCKQLPTGTVTLNQIRGKILSWCPILTKKVWNIWSGGRGGDSNHCISANWSAKISMNPQGFAKTNAKCPLWSGRIRKDSQQVQQLICKGSYKPLLVMCNDQQNQMFCKHTSHTSSYIYNFFFLLEIINYLLHCSLSSSVPLLWVYFQVLVILIVNENSLDQTSL